MTELCKHLPPEEACPYLPSFPIGLQLEVKTSHSLEMFILANLITENIMILAIF